MKKYLLIVLFSLFALNSVFSENQIYETLMNVQFEQSNLGNNDFAFDSSGYNHILKLGSWEIQIDVKSPFGNYLARQGGTGTRVMDLITYEGNFNLTPQYTYSFWLGDINSNDFSGSTRKILTHGLVSPTTSYMHTIIFNDGINSTFKVTEVDNNNQNIVYEFMIDNTTEMTENMKNFILTKNETHISLYFENDLVQSLALINPREFNIIIENYRIGQNAQSPFNGGSHLRGSLDNYQIYNWGFNETEINQIYTTNSVTLRESIFIAPPETDQVFDSVKVDLFTSFEPIPGSSTSSPTTIKANLIQQANCQLYVNSNLVEEYQNIMTFSELINLELGTHNVLIYCDYIVDNIKYYDFKNFNFEVENIIPSVINFGFTSKEFNVNEKSLYVVSPCLREGLNMLPFYKKRFYSSDEDGTYIRQVDTNQYVSFTMESNTHEFCLVHGQIQYNSNEKTNDFIVNKLYRQQEIGSFSVPSNITQTFIYDLTLQNIHNVWEVGQMPQAFGTTWTAIITSLIALLLGGLILIVGFTTQSKYAVLIGGALIILALGFQVGGVLGIVLT